jgi:hypothetical protein
VRRAGRVARDRLTCSACGREVTVGDALDTLTLRSLRDSIREAIGPPATTLAEVCDVILDEVCRQWPERAMADIARKQDSDAAGGQAFDAIAVITARVREQMEARYGCHPNHKEALDLILRACVIEFANLWFTNAEARIAMRRILFQVRSIKA